jgi:hypothetical protein
MRYHARGGKLDSMRLLAAAISTILLGGCECRPSLDSHTPPPDDTAKPDTTPPPGDSGAANLDGPCTLDEVEPDDFEASAMVIPTDVYLCGDFSKPADSDYFAITLAEDGWLGVYVDAQTRGSLADVLATVTNDADISAFRDDDDLSRDAHLLFPASAGTYSIWLQDENLAGGAGYDYELVASVAKPPVVPTKSEVEPNDDDETAMRVSDGDVILGGTGGTNDQDWYAIVVPVGSRTLVLDVDAYSLGAPGDYTVWLYEYGPSVSASEYANDLDGGKDPYVAYQSAGDETLYFRVTEQKLKGGPAYWYAIRVSLEDQ